MMSWYHYLSRCEADALHHENEVHIGKVEKNVGLRIDGDDLDHEHEPRVCVTA